MKPTAIETCASKIPTLTNICPTSLNICFVALLDRGSRYVDPLDMSNQWSCGTLEQGFGEVMVEAFHDDEQKIMAELEDW